MTTKVEINPGICQKKAIIEVNRSGSKVSVSLESDCAKVMNLSGRIRQLDTYELFISIADNAVYKASSEAHLHSACPVPCAILKAIEAESGLAKKKNVRILFVD